MISRGSFGLFLFTVREDGCCNVKLFCRNERKDLKEERLCFVQSGFEAFYVTFRRTPVHHRSARVERKFFRSHLI